MPSVGPDLPPHLAKRKRSEETPNTINDPTKRQRSSSPRAHPTNPRRVIGPAAPSAPLPKRLDTPTTSDPLSSDSNDDFGPFLPSPSGFINRETERKRQEALAADEAVRDVVTKFQRKEWMLLPPKQDDWFARADPSKLKNRKFNTDKGVRAPGHTGGAANALWTETPEQKRQRLVDEVMGVTRPARLGPEDRVERGKKKEAREKGRRVREYDERERGGALYSERGRAGRRGEEDDPSGRAFDREKDMGLGARIGRREKREMVSKARDFGARFEMGRCL
ncbi:MAG: hypothetical protein ALECFALPRED_000615 [Alectoria fallacina]|uniref:DUF3752 domain-containing protein n=1 Tax=Alectoria fallacina TaxID=1903189 RepID=A0A8H3I5F7_9LECA|nr:MAG: hypothetical protein ALECFALPRED_000615 [Alectoria fallacina]